jgi:hypothetical protein
MPVQTQQSTLAQRLGGQIAAANAEHKDKPLDLGFKKLPPGIRDGIGKLQTVQLKQYGQDEKIVALRGQEYLHVVGVVMHPQAFNGEKVAGHQMSIRFPLCAIPANPTNQNSKPVSFSDNWYEFQQFFMRFGIDPPNETPQSDPQGVKTWAYYLAAVQTLAGRAAGRDNIPYYEFTTRDWTPSKTTQQPNPKTMIFEDWGKQCQWNSQHDPAAGVNEMPPTGTQPAPFTEPPTGQVMVGNQPVTAPTATSVDPVDLVAALVETAMNDPEGATNEGAEATAKLEDLAWANGWTKDQTAGAADWSHVGQMCLNPPAPLTVATPVAAPTTPPLVAANVTPATGTKHLFAKRTKDGAKLKDNKGKEFPPQEVEVVTVNLTNKTCTVKTKDGKPVVDIRSKQPIDVKFEWLE